QHLDDRPLDDLVLQSRHTDRPLSAVRFRDVDTSHGLRQVRSSFQPIGKVLEIVLKILSVVLPGLAIDTRARVPFKRQVRGTQPVDVVDVVEECSEPLFLVPSCSLTYPLESAARVAPALSPERVSLGEVQH